MTLPWYHKTTIYQIYPRSFYDSNGDGVGDLKGIIQKLDYIRDLGFETIWISPFFSSPQADFGYDISNYTDIAPEYGTLADALQLIEEVHKRGMKIVFDMVMNHTSIEHPWFKESRSSRDNPKADWYIWKDSSPHLGGSWRGVPNNWQSVTNWSGWYYAKERGQYYWATFLPFQPDLNFRNPEVKEVMFDVVRFWLAKGVDGYRLDVFLAIYKDAEFRNHPYSIKLVPTDEDLSGFFRQAIYTLNLPETFAFARELRKVTNDFGEKLLLGEVAGSRATIRKFVGDEENNGLTNVFDFGILNFKFTAEYFREVISDIESYFPDPFMPVYAFSNHDKPRSIHRLGNDIRKAKLLHLLQLTMRGVPCMYNGEEIGMTNLRRPLRTALDPLAQKYKFLPRFIFDRLGLAMNRDEVRSPMQWDGSKNAGFSSAQKTWLPVHENYPEVNVEKEKENKDSLLNTIRSLLKIRREEKALQEGSLVWIDSMPHGVLGYARKLGEEKIFVLMNFTEQEQEFPFETSNPIFKLSAGDQIKEKAIRLDGYGGTILKIQ
jgi:oligo-1,6-glucosidase/alpha-glucosidase